MVESPEVQEYLRLKAQLEALRAEAPEPYQAVPTMDEVDYGPDMPRVRRFSRANQLSNILGGLGNRRNKEKLSNAEKELEAARLKALRGIQGRGADQAGTLEMLGAPKSMIEAAQPIEVNPTAAIQAAAQNPAMLPVMVRAGVITEEQAAQIGEQVKAAQNEKLAAAAAAKEEEFKRQKELQAQKDAAAMERAKLKPGKSGTDPGQPKLSSAGEKKANEIYERMQRAGEAGGRLDRLETDISGPRGDEAFSTGQQMITQAREATNEVPLIGAAVSAATAPFVAPGTAVINNATMDQVLQDMQKLGGNDSNEELRTLRARYPTNISSKETALTLTQDLKKWATIAARANELEYEDRLTSGGLPRKARNYFLEAQKELGMQFTGPPTQSTPAVAQPAPAPAAPVPAPAPTARPPLSSFFSRD